MTLACGVSRIAADHVKGLLITIQNPDCHFRVGGAAGTDLQKANCPKLSGSVDDKCIAGALMFYKSKRGGG